MGHINNHMSQEVMLDKKLIRVFFVLPLLQVVEKLIRGLAMEESKNLFSLFEHNSFTDRALESRVIVADVLAKFERYLSAIYKCFPEGFIVIFISAHTSVA